MSYLTDENFEDDGFYTDVEDDRYVQPHTYPIGFADEPLWDEDEEEDFDYEDGYYSDHDLGIDDDNL